MQAKREKPDPATFLGSGKIEELGILAKEAEVDVVVLISRFQRHRSATLSV